MQAHNKQVNKGCAKAHPLLRALGIQMCNCETTQELIALHQQLGMQMQGELPVLCTALSNKVAIRDPNIRQTIQDNLNHATGCLSVVYVFALLENHKFNISNKWLNEDEKLKCKAWKHLRHSAAHGFDGKRADRYKEEFNEMMNSNDPLQCVEHWDNDSVKVHQLLGFRCLEYFLNLIPLLLARSANA